MPPRRSSRFSYPILEGCIFPPEIISRICSFYIPLYEMNKDNSVKILPLLSSCKAVSQMVIPMLYAEVIITKPSQFVTFLDPAKTPSIHYLHMTDLDIEVEEYSLELVRISGVAYRRGKDLLNLPTSGRKLRDDRGRNGQPRKLLNLCLTFDVRAYWSNSIIWALEPIYVHIPEHYLFVTAPWMSGWRKVLRQTKKYNDKIRGEYLSVLGTLWTLSDYGLMMEGDTSIMMKLEPRSDGNEPLPRTETVWDNHEPAAGVNLEGWEAGEGVTKLQVRLTDPDERTERMAKEWADKKEGAEVIIVRTVVQEEVGDEEVLEEHGDPDEEGGLSGERDQD